MDEVTRHGQSKENIETVRKLQTREGLINIMKIRKIERQMLM
jgi:hypothetical protein